MKSYIFIGILILALIAVIVFIQQTGSQCSKDSDCIPQGCHATTCVPKTIMNETPVCTQIEECTPNTLDCGQGACACVKGMCKAEMTK